MTTEMRLTQQLIRQVAAHMTPDYIPNGTRRVPLDRVLTLRFRRTTNNEVLRCGAIVGHDIQSGSIYCGDLADFVAPTDTQYVAVCERHRPLEKR